MKSFFLACWLLLVFQTTQAQSFYVTSPRSNTSDLYKVTKSANGFIHERINACFDMDYFSIAMDSEYFYWIGGNSLYRGQIDGSSLVSCSQICPIPYSNALTLGTDKKLYHGSGSLLITDPATGQTRDAGRTDRYPSGDLTFFDGDLYMATQEGLVKINASNPSQNELYLPWSGLQSVYGLVSVGTSLQTNTVYAFSQVNSNLTNIVELDIVNKRIIGTVGSLPFVVYDAASIVENGSITGIVVDRVNLRQDCSSPENGIIEAITKPHTAPITYHLSNGAENRTGLFTEVPPGNYELIISSALDSKTESITVPEYNLDPPVYTIRSTNQVCDVPGALHFRSENPGDFRVRMNNAEFPLNHSFSRILANQDYHYQILNGSGCEVDAGIATIQREICRIELDQVIIQKECNAINKGSVQLTMKPHTQPYSFELNGSVNSTGYFGMLDPGDYTVHITSPEDTKDIPFKIPDYSILVDEIEVNWLNPLCEIKGNISFDMDNSSLYKIKFNNQVYPLTHVFTDLDPGTYHFTLTDLQECYIDVLDVELIREKCLIKFDRLDFTQQCDALFKAEMIVSTFPHADEYTYTLDAISNTTGNFNNLAAGDYILKIQSPEDYLEIPVTVPDYSLSKPVLSYLITPPVCNQKGDIQFAIQGNSEKYQFAYLGKTYSIDHLFSGLDGGYHQFILMSKDGCLLDQIDINVKPDICSPVLFPNTFTPNGDGRNDIFRADPESKAVNFRLQIFDRWGAILFNSINLEGGWNGEYNGSPVPVGTYYWVSSFTSQDKLPVVLKGYVTVIR